MNKSKHIQVEKVVKKTANKILAAKVVEVYEDDMGWFKEIHLSNGIIMPFREEPETGFRFYSPLTYVLEENEDVNINADYDSSKLSEITKAVHDWAFAWKCGAFHDNGYMPKHSLPRKRTWHRCKYLENAD